MGGLEERPAGEEGVDMVDEGEGDEESPHTLNVFMSWATRPRPTHTSTSLVATGDAEDTFASSKDTMRLDAAITRKSFPLLLVVPGG